MPCLHKGAREREAVDFALALALVNFHLLQRHIDGADSYATREGLSLREVFETQLLLRTARQAPR